jgi:rhamnose transport system permease protein
LPWAWQRPGAPPEALLLRGAGHRHGLRLAEWLHGHALRLPSIVVTIGTVSLFRGLASVVLGDQAFTGYPQ